MKIYPGDAIVSTTTHGLWLITAVIGDHVSGWRTDLRGIIYQGNLGYLEDAEYWLEEGKWILIPGDGR